MTLNQLGRALWLWAPVVACVAAVHYGSVTPPAVLPAPIVPHSDKAVHAGAYGVMAALLARAMRGSTRASDATVAAAAFVAATLWGGVEEWFQMSLAARSSEWGDVLANAAGGALAALAWLRVRAWLARRHASPPR